MELGYSLSSEEFGPKELIEHARRAEEVGFEFALISDHYHPWTDRQGQSPFVWSVIGGIAQVTKRLRLGTGVTCPTMRMSPAIIAQAAATAAVMMPGRFFLGVGAGENLNEHILGAWWPPPDIRRAMLAESIELIRKLWEGKYTSHRGKYFRVENARIYTRPATPPPVYVAAGGKKAAELAARLGDGLIGAQADPQMVNTFRHGGGKGKPSYGHLTVCWGRSVKEARKTALEHWPNAGLASILKSELALPKHFEEAAEKVSEDDMAERVICGPDADEHAAKIQEYAKAGYTHVYVHQIGPDQEGFFKFYKENILPRFAAKTTRRRAA